MYKTVKPYSFSDGTFVFNLVFKPITDSIRVSVGVFVECSVLSVRDSVSNYGENLIRKILRSYDFRREK